MILLTDKDLKTAENDIVVYVTLFDGKVSNPWNCKIDKVTTILNGKYAYFGYHSSRFYEELKLFHDLLGPDDRENHREIYMAIIPKGSKYYLGAVSYSFAVSREHLNIETFCSDKLIIAKKM